MEESVRLELKHTPGEGAAYLLLVDSEGNATYRDVREQDLSHPPEYHDDVEFNRIKSGLISLLYYMNSCHMRNPKDRKALAHMKGHVDRLLLCSHSE